MALKRYTLSVTSADYWDKIHGALTVDSNEDGIPDRKITCTDEKKGSPTRGTYELTDEEAAEIALHPHVNWIELSLRDNPDSFPKPELAMPQRWPSDVKAYRDLDSPNNPPTTVGALTSAEMNRTNWAVPRVGVKTAGEIYGANVGNLAAISTNTNYTYDGRNVDIVIHDSGVLRSHPEFLNDDGTSRVKDIVLDGPYLIDKPWFDTYGYVYTREDGTTGISTANAIAWWEDNNARSTSKALLPTINIPANYTCDRAVGVGTTGGNSLTSGHGTACAGMAAGKNMGMAFKANIWNMPAISDNVGMDIETSYDLIKFFHQHKPVDAELGVQLPTVVNGSWGYQAATGNTSQLSWKFKNNTGSITMPVSSSSDPVDVSDMIFGFNNQVLGAYKSWTSSSRNNASDTAGAEMMAAGVIYISAAGNNNQRIGVGFTDIHRTDGLTDAYFGSNDSRAEFGGTRTPCGSRDWMNPSGIGFNSTTGYHPVINVGAMDDFIESNLKERKATYSNSGPGIDIYAPADETLAPGLHNISQYRDYPRYDNSGFFDAKFSGTSAAAPVVAGLVALYAQRNPSASPTEAKNWVTGFTTDGQPPSLRGQSGSTVLGNDLFFDQHPDIDTANFWSGQFNQRTLDGNGNVNVTYIDVDSGISTELAGINDPSVLEPVNNATGVNTEGLILRSSAYTAIGGTTVSGTLKGVEFQLSQDPTFSVIEFQSTVDNVGLEQSTTSMQQFDVEYSFSSGSGDFASTFTPVTYTVYVVSAQQGGYGGDFYTFGGGGSDRNGGVSGNAPTINITVGDTLIVDLSAIAPAHPFAIRTSLGGSSAGGVTGEGTATVTWDTTGLTAGTYYYQCMSHPAMNGIIVLSAAGGSGGGGGGQQGGGGGGQQGGGGQSGGSGISGVLAGFTTYYARVRHISNNDGQAFTGYYSDYSAGIVSFATLGNAPGVQTPFIVAPTNASNVTQRFGIVLTSSSYIAINGDAVSGTLKGVEFEVSTDATFADTSQVVYTSIGAANPSLSQTINIGLAAATTFYVRLRHVSNADGTEGQSFTSPFSVVTSFVTPDPFQARVGRLASVKTTLTKGVVEPTLLFESEDLLEVSIAVANQNDFKSTFSVGISSTPGFKPSDYIAYGIELDRGGTRLIEKVGIKPGDKIFVSSFDPNVSFLTFATKIYDKISDVSAATHGRKESLTLSFRPPHTINTNLEILTAEEDSLITVHATNQNPDITAALSVGISSGGVSDFQEADYVAFGLRLAPLQDVQIDNLALSNGQSVIVRGSKPNLTFVAHSIPQDPGPSGIGSNLNVNTTGIITAQAFSGDGTGLTGVTAVGSGVQVEDGGTIVGAAATINFGNNISATVTNGVALIEGSDTVGVAETANSLADGVAVALAAKSNYADVAGIATVATTATNATTSQTAVTANTASQLDSNATINVSNNITAPKFIGDGSELTNIVAAGSGVIVQDSGSAVGTAGTINFAAGIDVSPISAGIVTATIVEAPRATLAGIASEAIVCGVATFATLAGLASQATNATFASAASFSTLTGAADTAKNLYTEHENPFKPLPVTIGTKTTRHRYIGIGSDKSINIQGYESPYLRFEVGQTYRFENAAQQSNYPIRLYYHPSGVTSIGIGTTNPSQMTQGVTETGSYTEIEVTEQTPDLFYYGAGVGTEYGSMGNSVQVFNPEMNRVAKVGEFKNTSGLKTCTYTQMFEGRATSWYLNTNLGVGNSDYVPGDRSHNVSSIEQVSTGVYQVNFADPMADTNYAVIGIASGTNAFPGGIVNLRISDRTVDNYTVRVYNGIPALEDLGELSIMTLGGQDGEPTYI